MHRPLGLLTKNRDKYCPTPEEIIQEGSFVAVRTKGTDYFSTGMNQHGCAFASTAVNSPRWINEIEKGNLEVANQIALKENQGLKSPTKIISKLLAEVKSVEQWIDTLQRTKETWLGYNIVLIDPEKSVRIETYRDQLHIKELDSVVVITNHFESLDYGPKIDSEYPSTFERYRFVSEKLSKIHTLEELSAIIKPGGNVNYVPTWRSSKFFTVSSTLLNLNSQELFYSVDRDRKYSNYSFRKSVGNLR